MQHPDPRSLDAYSRRELLATAMLDVGDHVAECAECRGQLRQPPLTAVWPAEDMAIHLSEDEIAGLPELLSAEAQAHLAECEQCQAEADDARRFYSPDVSRVVSIETGAPPLRRRTIFVIAGLAAACLLFALALPQLRQSHDSDRTVLVAALHDAGGEIGIDSQGNLSTPRPMPPEYSAMLRDVLSSHRLPVVEGLVPERSGERLRTEGAHDTGEGVVSPSGEITGRTPALTWNPVPGARSYNVTVYDSSFAAVEQSSKLNGTTWTPTAALTAGATYRWIVKAETSRGVVQVPLPPAPEARFTVADPKTLASVEQVMAQYPAAHLLRAAVYASAGMNTPARQELAMLDRENPQSPLVKQLRASLDQLFPTSTKPAQ